MEYGEPPHIIACISQLKFRSMCMISKLYLAGQWLSYAGTSPKAPQEEICANSGNLRRFGILTYLPFCWI